MDKVKFYLSADDIKPLVATKEGCIASNRITKKMMHT